MLFFINSVLGACSGEYIGARSITPHLAGAPAWSMPEQVYWSKVPKCLLSAGAPLCSVPRRVCWSIYQRSARMGLCKKSS